MTEMEKSILIQKVLDGSASPAEKTILNKLMDQDPSLKEQYEDLKLFYSFGDEGGPPSPGAFERIKQLYYRRRKRKRFVRRLLVSTMALMLMGSIVIWRALPARTSNLIFVDENIATVISVLESEYAVEIETDNSDLLQCRFTGTFLRVSSADEVLPYLVIATNAHIQRTGRKIILKGGECL